MSDTGSTGSSAAGGHERRGEGLLMLWLGCSAFLFFLIFNHGHFIGSDEVAIYEMTQSIVERGDLAIPPIQHTAVGPDGRRYSFFTAGQSVLAAPLYQLGLLAEKWLPYDWRRVIAGPRNGYGPFVFGGEVPIGFVSLYAPLASTLLVLVFYQFSLALGTSRRNALLATALLATCTYVLMMSTYFLRHAPESAALLGSFYFFFRYKQGGPLRDLWIGCSLAVLVPLLRVPAALNAPVLAAYLAWVIYLRSDRFERKKVVGAALLAIAVPLTAAVMLHVTFNYMKWETFFTSPMVAQIERLKNPIAIGLQGFLFSPGSSVFVYSPLLLLIPWTLPNFWKRWRAEAVAFISLALFLLLVYSLFDGWEGLWSAPGPRYLFFWTPMLMLPLGPWLDTARSRIARIAVGVLALLGFAVQLVSTVVRWGSVPALAGYAEFEPRWGFLFSVQHAPVVEMGRLLFRGGPIDPWIWNLAQGWTGFPARPGVAAAIFALWAVVLAASLFALWRETLRLEARP